MARMVQKENINQIYYDKEHDLKNLFNLFNYLMARTLRAAPLDAGTI